ncbi:MAG TPA: LCP family protein [Verrucomicrobiae bacterium]|nr:LCP family protein [Verrucomicrobiae bacterium]
MASYRSIEHGSNVFDEFTRLPGIVEVRKAVMGDASVPAEPEARSTVNVLILGIGGAGHDGSLLTDTIILASIDMKNKRVAMLSIPRDLAWKLPDGSYEKINAVGAYEEQDHPGEGARRTADDLSQFFGVPIDHVLRIDFRGFSELIDTVGGVDVNVEHSFTDEQYPTSDDGWTTVSFKKGMQHMSGQTALVFVRSRHGNNGEGSDFARSRRQQLVLMALRDKLLSLNTLADPGKLAKMYSSLASHIQTDLTPWDALAFAPLLSDFDPSHVTTHVLTDAPDGELVATNLNNNFLLFPKDGNWDAIKDLAQNPFATEDSSKQTAPPLAKVELKNGTFRTGFAAQVSSALTLAGYQAVNDGNASHRQYAKTMIFDLTGGRKPEDLNKLRVELDADVSLSSPVSVTGTKGTLQRFVYPDATSKELISATDTDFLVILGESAYPFLNTTSSYAVRENP